MWPFSGHQALKDQLSFGFFAEHLETNTFDVKCLALSQL